MKMKLTTLLFGLLLAVGWTSNAFAQPATYTAESIKDLRYEWTDAAGTTHSEPYVVYDADKEAWVGAEVTNPYQIYGLLRGVYMEKALPGPYQSAYKADGVTREDDIFYGGCDNGWNIPGTYTTSGTITSTIGQLRINFTNYSNSYPVLFKEIRIATSGNKLLAKWTAGTSLPTGWSSSGTRRTYTTSNTTFEYFYGSSGYITIPASVTQGYDNVEVVVTAMAFNTNYTGTINVNSTNSQSIKKYTDYGWNFSSVGHKNFASDTYKPDEEGYTAIVVAMKNTSYLPWEPGIGGSTGYNDPDSVINYIDKNIQFVKLLTDGLRIKDGENLGTVFNCDGSYNKFFFLGKGKARQKGAEVQSRINSNAWAGYAGECVIFWPLFEEFSPTTGTLMGASSIVDFYDRMMEGSVYSVKHDCAGVIQNRHEFTLAGEDKTDDYPFTGLNFFIPDYRLKYWVGKDSVYSNGSYTYYDVDGRDMNAMYSTTGYNFNQVTAYYCNYAQYNPDYAPKVGVYKITLSATATFVGDATNPDHSPENLNYVVTLHWVSSLNEMSGTDIPQTYTIWCYDNVTGERFKLEATGVTNPTGQTTVSYLVPQRAHSYTIEYIIQGWPNDNDHPSFVAWSNRDNVVIPGWDDFVGLQLDHHESDFVPNEMANYYRNFLEVVNEDIYNGLTVDKIKEGMNEFTLYRFLYKEQQNENGETELVPVNDGTPIAKLTFGTPNETAGTVPYTVTYLNTQDVLETPKYDLDENHLNIPLTGVIRIKGNGDLVIWPNGYAVNFKSITVKNGNTTLASWDVTSGDGSLPSGWIMSPGSVFEVYMNNGDKVGYVDGGGYIAIPNIVTEANYNDLRIEIVAYGDAGTVSRITVNDYMQTINNGTPAKTYKWGGNGQNDTPISPYAAPRRDNNTNN